MLGILELNIQRLVDCANARALNMTGQQIATQVIGVSANNIELETGIVPTYYLPSLSVKTLVSLPAVQQLESLFRF